jgi:hypothetical protein
MTEPFASLRSTAVLLAVVLAAAVAACGDDDQRARTSDRPATTQRSGTPGAGPSLGGDVVATLDVHGGFRPVERAVADTADVVALGDGTVISAAAMTLQYPGPAMAPLQVGQAPPAVVGELAAAIDALDPDARYDPPGPAQVADAPVTTVTLRRGGEVVVSVSAYGLGREDEQGARGRLAEVVGRFESLPTADERPYEPVAVRVHDVTEQAGDPPGPATTGDPPALGGPSGHILDWPLDHDGRPCSVVDDPAGVAAVLEVLAGATELDWFRTGGGVRRLVAAPLLPGDPGCPGP